MNIMNENSYPQSEKLADAHNERQAIASFIEWLAADQGIVLAELSEESGRYEAVLETADTIIMRYLDIDEKALE